MVYEYNCSQQHAGEHEQQHHRLYNQEQLYRQQQQRQQETFKSPVERGHGWMHQ